MFNKNIAQDKPCDQGQQAEYLESLMKKAGELNLRYTTIDAGGNLEIAKGIIRKADLCKQHDLDPRDLRKIDSLQPNLVPTILSRRSAIFINMLHVRALIKADKVILFDPVHSAEGSLRSKLLWHIQGNVRAMTKLVNNEADEQASEDGKNLSYEHRVLESILLSVANALEEEMAYTRQIVSELLADLENDIDRENLKQLLHYSRRLAGFQSRVKYVLASIEEVLESDEDLSAMYLTAKSEHRPRSLADHEELEMLLESFAKQVEEIVSEVDTIVANMQSTQEIAELMLDSNRNTLIALDLKVSIGTLGVGVGALTAGVFGMNLTSNLETAPNAFYFVTGTAVAVAAITTFMGLKRLRAMSKIGINTGRKSKPIKSTRVSLAQRMRNMLWRRAGKDVNKSTKSPGKEDPVWINQHADAARARDAIRAEAVALRNAGHEERQSLLAARWKGHGELSYVRK